MEGTNHKLTDETALCARFLHLLNGQVGHGIYVWGGNGELLSAMRDPKDWIRARETSAVNAERAIALWEKRIRDGIDDIRAFDCSGLIYWALKELGMRRSDVSSRGLYALCDPIGEDALIRGDLVFHHDGTQIVHVGVWDGDAQIECKGRDAGVVRNKRKPGYWNRFGRLPALSCEPAERVWVKGGSVRVRTGDSTKSKCIGIVHKGESYPLLGRGASGWYRIAWHGTEAFITNKPQYTEVRCG